MRMLREFFAALQFMTRLPVPSLGFEPDTMRSATKFYPLVGALVALGAGALERALRTHLPAAIVALLVLAYLIVITGGFHEDGLADTADALGGGRTKARMLEIMRDSRIGSFGASALVVSLLSRWILLSALQPVKFFSYLLAAQVLCRWTVLPLAVFLSPAREDGSGVQLARRIPASPIVIGSALAFLIAAYALRVAVWVPTGSVIGVTVLSGIYYRSQIGGVTGDCFGATIQVSEIAVYLCGVWQ